MSNRHSCKESSAEGNHFLDRSTILAGKCRGQEKQKTRNMKAKLTANACAAKREIMEKTKKPAGAWLELRPKQPTTSTSSSPLKIPPRGKVDVTNIKLPSMSGRNRSRSNSSGNFGTSPTSVAALGCW